MNRRNRLFFLTRQIWSGECIIVFDISRTPAESPPCGVDSYDTLDSLQSAVISLLMIIVNPSVAIITPTKNRFKLLCETMDSVRKQTFGAWEHIIVDDGSDDDTAEEVNRQAAVDPRVRYVRRDGDKAGANVCRNLGVRATSAPLIMFLDSDDLLEPCCLEERVQIMERNVDLDFATFQTALFQKHKNDLGRILDADLLGDDLLRFLFFEVPWIITAPIWRRSTLFNLGLLDELLLSWQDIDLHIRAVVSQCKYLRFATVDHHVRWQFEATKISVLQRHSPKHLEASMYVFEKFEKLLRARTCLTWTRQRALCSLYFFIAERWVDNKNISKAVHTWHTMRLRRLGGRGLWITGLLFLTLLRISPTLTPTTRLIHKWKGWMRLRTNPELLK